MAKKANTAAKAVGGDYLQTINPKGYLHNREITNLPGQFLVQGSQNVVIKNAERVDSRKGYTLLGGAKTMNKGIKGSTDWKTSTGVARSLRSYDDELEVFYKNAWVRLKNLWTNVKFQFLEDGWWNSTELLDVMLFVNGTPNVYEWSGGITEVASVTVNTITKQGYLTGSTISFSDNGTNADTIFKSDGGFSIAGFAAGDEITITGSTSNDGEYTIFSVDDNTITLAADDVLTTEAAGASVTIGRTGAGTWAEERFYANGTRGVLIDGQPYTYMGGENTGTLTGVSPDPTGAGIIAGDLAFQDIRTNTPSALVNSKTNLISIINNQVFYGSTFSRVVYMTKDTDFTDVTESTLRVPGEGSTMILDACPTSFAPGQDAKEMYIGAGKDYIYQITFVQSTVTDGGVGKVTEQVQTKKFKNATGLAPQNQGSIVFVKNAISYYSFEPTVDYLGRVANVVIDSPQNVPLSDPIRDDIESYDATGVHGKYFRRNLYYCLPNEGKVINYDYMNGYWQPPHLIAISRLAVIEIDGVDTLCGHASNANETYILYRGYNDNASKFLAVAAFGYENYGSRFSSKLFDELAAELYMSLSTVVTDRVLYDYKGATGLREFPINPSDPANAASIFQPIAGASLGSNPLGSNPLGSSSDDLSDLPKVRIIHTTTKLEFYERQRVFYSDSIDCQFRILAYGENVELGDNLPTDLKH